jgi:hypothetical protein
MMKCDAIFEAQSEFLNIIYTNFGFKGLIHFWVSTLLRPLTWTALELTSTNVMNLVDRKMKETSVAYFSVAYYSCAGNNYYRRKVRSSM